MMIGFNLRKMITLSISNSSKEEKGVEEEEEKIRENRKTKVLFFKEDLLE